MNFTFLNEMVKHPPKADKSAPTAIQDNLLKFIMGDGRDKSAPTIRGA